MPGLSVPVPWLSFLSCALVWWRLWFSAGPWQALQTVPVLAAHSGRGTGSRGAAAGSVPWQQPTSWWAGVPLPLPQSGVVKSPPNSTRVSPLCLQGLSMSLLNTGPGGSGESSGKENIRISSGHWLTSGGPASQANSQGRCLSPSLPHRPVPGGSKYPQQGSGRRITPQ